MIIGVRYELNVTVHSIYFLPSCRAEECNSGSPSIAPDGKKEQNP